MKVGDLVFTVSPLYGEPKNAPILILSIDNRQYHADEFRLMATILMACGKTYIWFHMLEEWAN